MECLKNVLVGKYRYLPYIGCHGNPFLCIFNETSEIEDHYLSTMVLKTENKNHF